MRNLIRTLFILLMVSMSFIKPLMADTVLHGTLREKLHDQPPIYFNFYHWDDARTNFPLNHYEYQLFAYDLRYDEVTPEKYRIKDLYNFSGEMTANLDLISSDLKTNTYKFKLSLTPTGLKYIGRDNPKLLSLGGHFFNGTVTLADGSPAVFFIEVKLQYDEKRNLVLINSGSNKYFEIEILGRNSNPTLIRKYDFPVIMTKK